MFAVRKHKAFLPAISLVMVGTVVWCEDSRHVAVAADDAGSLWPQWRGPSRDARVPDGPPWPSDLKGLERIWRVDLGPSYSGPIVAQDRVFVTETRDKSTEVVRALDRAGGKVLWETSWPGAIKVPFFASSNGSWIRATPVYDGDSLFVPGMRDVLVCLNAEDGKEKWRIDFVEELSTPLPSFGQVSSPLLDGDHLYVQAAASLMKISKHDGKIVWRTLQERGGMMDSAFSSPVVAKMHGVRQIVVQTRQELAGVSPDSGTVLWRQQVPAYRGMNILTPTVFENSVFTSTYKNATFLYRLENDDDEWRVREAWKSRAQGYMSSPVLVGHHAYLPLGNGRLACFDLRAGAELWRSKSFGKYWSVVCNHDRIIALNDRGELFLLDADPSEFRLLDRRSVSDQETWGHLAVAGENVYVRELKGLSAFRWNRSAVE